MPNVTRSNERDTYVTKITDSIRETEGHLKKKLTTESDKADVAKALSDLRATLEKAPKQLETLRQRHTFFLAKFFVWIKDKFQLSKISKEIAKIDTFVRTNNLNTAPAQPEQPQRLTSPEGEPNANANLAKTLLEHVGINVTEKSSNEQVQQQEPEEEQVPLNQPTSPEADPEANANLAEEVLRLMAIDVEDSKDQEVVKQGDNPQIKEEPTIEPEKQQVKAEPDTAEVKAEPEQQQDAAKPKEQPKDTGTAKAAAQGVANDPKWNESVIILQGNDMSKYYDAIMYILRKVDGLNENQAMQLRGKAQMALNFGHMNEIELTAFWKEFQKKKPKK